MPHIILQSNAQAYVVSFYHPRSSLCGIKLYILFLKVELRAIDRLC